MAPGPSPETIYSAAERAALLAVATQSVEMGLRSGAPFAVDPAEHPISLRALRASFVTLRIDDELRGCTGRLEAEVPLVIDVAGNAFRSAYRDPRFTPVAAEELPQLSYHISVLSAPEPLPVESEAELLSALRPGVDGLLLRRAGRRRPSFRRSGRACRSPGPSCASSSTRPASLAATGRPR